MSSPIAPTTTKHRRGSDEPEHAGWPRRVLCAVLVLAPVVAALAVPLYQRQGPTLDGIPFFFWFQMLMAVAAAVGTGLAYRLLFANANEEAVRS